ncbi:hypothetical protein GW17_00033690 [Ensete ventricosum]|nr:hypothetical protein GW17_00033690 [Ensete ventricosum]
MDREAHWEHEGRSQGKRPEDLPQECRRLPDYAGLQPDDVPRYSLGIGLSSDNTMGSRRKFARRFVEGIGKLAGNAKGDRRKEDRRTCRKITGGCRNMQEFGLN